ncbi:MAG: glycosyltransferase [Chloroflexota bacterium]|jgi:1,2-diacylglycerol 3-beta-galactosyltransferase
MLATKKKVLILTADAGFGHRSAANALAAALRARYGEAVQAEILNPLDDRKTPLLLRESQSDYDRLIRKAPELYKLGYDASDLTVTSTLLESTLTVMLFEVMRDTLRKHRPDVIVTTYPLYLAPLYSVFSIFRTFVPLVTVVTDLASVHRLWFHSNVDFLLTPTSIVRDLAIEAGVAAEKIHVTGIPVDPLFAEETRTPPVIRQQLGWLPDNLTVLVAGSKRVSGMIAALKVINHFGAPLQLAVVCGKDHKLFNELHQMTWHVPVHLYEYTNQMPLLMRASDLIVCKAGGLIVTESLACGLPMLLIDVIPGQEKGNMEYVVNNGAGDAVENPMDMLETLSHLWMNDQALLKQRAAQAQKLGRPRAAYEAAGMIWQAALGGRRVLETSWRKPLLALLRANQITAGENESLTGDE